MNWFDLSILSFLNQFSQESDKFNKLLGLLSGNLLLKGGLLTTLLWWAWFRNSKTEKRDREFVVAGIALAMTATLLARLIALFAPLRIRPRYDVAMHFKIPSGSADLDMLNWSSFPSDHATLFFCIAMILFFISRKVGVFALLHALFVVSLPRIYFGLHYPTDILGGMVIGAGFACVALHGGIRQAIARPVLRWMEASPQSFYPGFSLCLLLVATLFDPIREVMLDVWRAANYLTR